LTRPSAIRIEADLQRFHTRSGSLSIIAHHVPEATLFDRKDDLSDFIDDKDVIAIGPGLGGNEDTRRTTEYLIEHFEGPLVIDADGLYELQKLKDKIRKRKHTVIITPHPGEMARLIDVTAGEVNKNRFDISRGM